MLVGFFAAYVVPPGLYAHSGDFGPHREIVSPSVLRRRPSRLGQALVGRGHAIATSGELRAPEPQLESASRQRRTRAKLAKWCQGMELGFFAWNIKGGVTASKAVLSHPERYQDVWH